MLTTNETLLASFKGLSRTVAGEVEVYSADSSTVSQTLLPNGTLASIKIEDSIPNGKFFGFAITRKLTVNLIERLPLEVGTMLKPYIYTKGAETKADLPFFYVDKAEVNDTTNSTAITAYDGMHLASQKTIGEVDITYPIKLSEFAAAAASYLGYTISADFTGFDITLEEATTNLDGTELISDIFAAIAEATGTFCFCSSGKVIKFLNLQDSSSDTIKRDSYFELTLQEPIELTQIASGTDLGDNYTTGEEGFCQVIWNNPFLELREDITTLIDNIGTKVIGTRIFPYAFSGRGNPFYEPGDKLVIQMKDDTYSYIYHFNEVLEYTGGLKSKTSWVKAEEERVEATPTTIGESVKQTYAKVDKINKKIELLASEVNDNSSSLASLKLDTQSISASVSNMQTTTSDAFESINGEISTLNQKVEAQITAEDVKLSIQSELANGVDKVITSTGFTFNEEGLTVSKTGSEMTTTIDEDGMSVYRDAEEVLTADNEGVIAYNLHAKTYLIVGESSRFEDYEDEGETRTGCFWIGGSN